MLDPPVRLGLIGAGAFGKFSLSAYAESGDVRAVAVADSEARALDDLAGGALDLYASWEPIVADSTIEAIHIATPPFLREEIVVAALRAGKAVFCEKPLALTLESADRMIAEARSTGAALGVNYVMRHHPAYWLAAALYRSGLMGETRTVSFENIAQIVPPDHWFWDLRLSGGIFVEHGVHFFDVLGQFTGPALDVAGRAPRREAVEALVSYEGGAIGRYYHEFAFPRQVEYAGATLAFTRGHIRVEGWIPTRLTAAVMASPDSVREVLRGDAVPAVSADDEATTVTALYPDRQGEYRRAIVRGLRDLVRSRRDPTYRRVVSLGEARASLDVAIRTQTATTKLPI